RNLKERNILKVLQEKIFLKVIKRRNKNGEKFYCIYEVFLSAYHDAPASLYKGEQYEHQNPTHPF
ncbi:hypothetical protein, partial [Candidatus Parabeggiatoa sp. HSG14]|uniref:hypothetical protein n=1 Tax=Candidatus Parabeggiatoa sp. HSG14 TaxID=3055593 RepID=UPI0025A820BF|nr:hypothetical protein [Thiotrichales bacterium HSG14]